VAGIELAMKLRDNRTCLLKLTSFLLFFPFLNY